MDYTIYILSFKYHLTKILLENDGFQMNILKKGANIQWDVPLINWNSGEIVSTENTPLDIFLKKNFHRQNSFSLNETKSSVAYLARPYTW